MSALESVVAMIGKIRWASLALAKLLPIVKGLSIGAAIFVGAVVAGAPVHDIWFDWILFMLASAIIGGMPEPDLDLPFWKFMYLWAFRSGHLLVSQATAYFLHQKKWQVIRGELQAPSTRRDTAVE